MENTTRQDNKNNQVQELTKEVENLNMQIDKYEKMWRNVDLQPKHFDSRKLQKIYKEAD
mgnify:CR=1 FL=1